jgi:hypothetical protein
VGTQPDDPKPNAKPERDDEITQPDALARVAMRTLIELTYVPGGEEIDPPDEL